MSRPLTTTRIIVVFALAAVALVVMGGVSYWQTERLVESDQWVSHTREVMDSLRAVLASATTAETEARGFALCGAEPHLENYEAAAAEIPQRLETLAALTKDNPKQQQEIVALRRSTNERLAHLQALVDATRSGGVDAARRFEISSSSDHSMTELRRHLEAMRRVEKDLLAERAARAAASSRTKIATEIAAAALGLAAIALAFFLYRSDVSAHQREAARLEWQVRNEAAMAELRERALSDAGLQEFLDHAVDLVQSALQVELVKVLELRPDGESLLLKAGKGWKPGLVGTAVVGAGLDSQAGFTLLSSEQFVVRGDLTTHKPVVVDDLRCEKRFNGPPLLREHGVVSGMSVMIDGQPNRPYGVLGVHTRRPRRFSEEEAAFLEAAAKVAAAYVQRRFAEDALVESEQRFRQLADAIPQLSWVARPDGSVAYFNRRWYEFTRLSPQQSLAPDGWKAALHPDDAEQCDQLWGQAVNSGELFEVECRYHDRATGGFRWMLARALPLWSESGEIRQWFGTVTDIDDQKRVQLSLLEADRRKNEFVATLAHELRNPIAPIAHAVEILKLAGSNDPRVEQGCEIITHQVRQVRHLVDDLMEIERIALGKIRLHKERVELRQVFQCAAEAVRPLLEQRDQEFTIELPQEPVWLDVDRTRIVQVIGNLLHNAVKFTPYGGKIALSGKAEGSQAVVVVRDTGAGIPPEMLLGIFDLFTQVDDGSARALGGLGIGLNLVRDLVQLHGGSVQAASDGPGRGSTFVVRLPRMLTASRRERLDGPHLETGPPPKPQRVLLVDDHKSIVDSLAALLRQKGHDACCAYDAVSALETARRYLPDIVVSDIGLPGMDGYELAARLRRDPLMQNTRLVALTGFSHEEVRRRILEAGFSQYLVKPLTISELDALLEADAPCNGDSEIFTRSPQSP
jgi:PAS domain S-box-containing protein